MNGDWKTSVFEVQVENLVACSHGCPDLMWGGHLELWYFHIVILET